MSAGLKTEGAGLAGGRENSDCLRTKYRSASVKIEFFFGMLMHVLTSTN